MFHSLTALFHVHISSLSSWPLHVVFDMLVFDSHLVSGRIRYIKVHHQAHLINCLPRPRISLLSKELFIFEIVFGDFSMCWRKLAIFLKCLNTCSLLFVLKKDIVQTSLLISNLLWDSFYLNILGTFECCIVNVNWSHGTEIVLLVFTLAYYILQGIVCSRSFSQLVLDHWRYAELFLQCNNWFFANVNFEGFGAEHTVYSQLYTVCVTLFHIWGRKVIKFSTSVSFLHLLWNQVVAWLLVLLRRIKNLLEFYKF